MYLIQKSLNQNSRWLMDFFQAFGPQLSIFYYLVMGRSIKTFFFFFRENGDFPTVAYIFTMETALVKIYFGHIFVLFVNRFSKSVWHFLRLLGRKK